MFEANFVVEEYILHVYCADDAVLEEARHRGTPLTGPYSADEHPSHITPNQQHLHIYFRNTKLFAINRDGTAHDASHGYRIPNKVAKALSQKFPKYQIAKDNVIESAEMTLASILIEIQVDRNASEEPGGG